MAVLVIFTSVIDPKPLIASFVVLPEDVTLTALEMDNIALCTLRVFALKT